MPEIAVRHQGGGRFHVQTGAHELVVDLPVEAGGENAGPAPIELFVTGVATCAAEAARAYLRAHGLPADGVTVACSYHLAPRTDAHLDSIDLTVCAPAQLTHEQRVGLSQAAAGCAAHAALRQPPLVAITVTAPQEEVTA